LRESHCFIRSLSIACWVGIWLLSSSFTSAHAESIDDLIVAQMREHHITGLSLAIVQDGRIVRESGFGFTDTNHTAPVTPATLFQAGSISKSVAAAGALHLVEASRLSLDTDVNTQLRTWRVPENQFTKERKVTLRGILTHNAGLTVHGFPGYDANATVPTLVQVLDGVKPANTPAIRVDTVPGSTWRYSGGGYTVMQQLIIDVTGRPFPDFMRDTVLKPFGMLRSTYEQPLPQDKAASTAAGYYSNGKAVKGGWHIYPEMAAAGLWTTASDLARFAIGVQQSLAAKSNPVISQAMTRQMLTPGGTDWPSRIQKTEDGLGVFLEGRGPGLIFSHNGRDEGFDALMMAYAYTGQGVVIMINSNDDSGAVDRIAKAIAREYHWPPSQ